MTHLPLYTTDPTALLRMRARHAEAPHAERAQEEAQLVSIYGHESLTIEVWHPRRRAAPLAAGTFPLDGGRLHARLVGGALPLQCLTPFLLPLEEWMDCTEVTVSFGQHKLWAVTVEESFAEADPSQPFFRQTPGEEIWRGTAFGYGSLLNQPPSLRDDDVEAWGGELFPSLSIDCAFPASARAPPLCEAEEEEVLSAVPLRVEGVTLRLESGHGELYNGAFHFTDPYALLKALYLSMRVNAWADAPETPATMLRRLVGRFRGSVLLLEVLDAGGRVVAYCDCPVVEEKKTTGDKSQGDGEDGEEWEEEGWAGNGDGDGRDRTTAYAMPPLFLRRGMPLQCTPAARGMTADDLFHCDHRHLLLDAEGRRFVTLSASAGDELTGRVLAPFARAIWLQPEFCRMPARLGGGMAARLALRPGSLDPDLQDGLEMREAPFASVDIMLLGLELCLLGVLEGEGEDDEDEDGSDSGTEGELTVADMELELD